MDFVDENFGLMRWMRGAQNFGVAVAAENENHLIHLVTLYFAAKFGAQNFENN